MKQKWYYQVLLRLRACLPLCDGPLPSQEPMTFYKLLLRGEKVKPGMPNKELVLQWNGGRGMKNNDILPLDDEDVFKLVPRTSMDCFPPPSDDPGPGRKRRALGLGRRGRPPAAAGGGGAGVDDPSAPPPVCGDPDPVPPVADAGGGVGPGSGGGDGGDGGSPAGAGDTGARGSGDVWALPPAVVRKPGYGEPVKSLNGVEVAFNRYVNTKGKEERHWVMTCQCRVGCNKRRGAIPAHEKDAGIIEPLGFLHAWRDFVFPSHPRFTTHQQETPTRDAIRAYTLGKKAELEDVCRRARRI